MDQPTPTRMVYRYNASGEKLHGVPVDYVVVNEDQTDDMLMQGWSLTPTDASELADVNRAVPVPVVETVPAPALDAPPTRAELEAKAKELGLSFDGRTKDKKLGEMIAAKLAG